MNYVPFVPEAIFPAQSERPIRPDASRLASAAAATLPTSFAASEQHLARQLSTLLDLNAAPHILATVCESFTSSATELLTRVRSDFPHNEPSSILTGLSDRHDHGRTVTSITFRDSRCLIYKPRSLAIEEWFFALCRELEPRLPTLSVIPRDHYGYVEAAQPRKCRTDDELRLYYRNAGALLCLLSVLQARDVHFQNLIACGTQPVLVDCETLLQPTLRSTADIDLTRTGMVPRFSPTAEHNYDVSALGGTFTQPTHFELPNISAALAPSINLASEEATLQPAQYLNDMADGFRSMYPSLSEHRDLLSRRITAATDIPIRYLLRDTMDYHLALGKIATGSSPGLALPTPAQTATALHPDELAQLSQLDVPRFTLTAGSRSLHSATDLFPRSGCDYALAALESLSDAHLSRQLDALRFTWNMYAISRALS